MDYLTVKAVHVGAVVATYILFALRGIWMIAESPLLAQRWVRIVPHLVDTVLLASAIAMAVMIRQYPFVAGWITAKVLALVLYILLGTIALKRGKTKRVRVGAWIAAQCVFAYIVAVAYTKNPLPFM